MTDRELLELAAKAAGYDIRSDAWACKFGSGKQRLFMGNNGPVWDTLTDDGDCARLEIAIMATVNIDEYYVSCTTYILGPERAVYTAEFFEAHNGDKNAARRLASTRAAAEIGKSLQEQPQ